MSTQTITVKASESVPLAKAYLCESCSCISVPANLKCTICGSAAILCLAEILGRQEKRDAAQ